LGINETIFRVWVSRNKLLHIRFNYTVVCTLTVPVPMKDEEGGRR